MSLAPSDDAPRLVYFLFLFLVNTIQYSCGSIVDSVQDLCCAFTKTTAVGFCALKKILGF